MKRTPQITRKNSRPARIFTNKKRSASINESDSEPKRKKSKVQVHSTERPKMKKDGDGNEYWEISKNRRVGISNFKGMALVNIREYYEKDGEMQPGKKGISLSLDQYSNLISILPDIEKLLIKKGEQVPRPKYDGGNKLGDNKDTDSEEADEEESEEKEAHSASDEEDEED